MAYEVVNASNSKTLFDGTLRILGINRASCRRPFRRCRYKRLLKTILDHVRSEIGSDLTIKESVKTIEIPDENAPLEDLAQNCMSLLENAQEAGFRYVTMKEEPHLPMKCLERRSFSDEGIQTIFQDYNNLLCTAPIVITKEE